MDASRIGAGWLVTCMIGGSVIVVTGYLSELPVLIALGAVAIAVGIGGVIWDVSAAVQRRKSQAQSQPTYRIEHLNLNIQISDSGSNTVSYGSNTVIVTPDGEGPLLPPGSILGRSWAESVTQSDAWKAEVIGPMTIEPILPPPKDDST